MASSQRGLRLIFQQCALKLWQEWQAHSNTLQYAHRFYCLQQNGKSLRSGGATLCC